MDSEIIAAKVFPAVWASMGLEITQDYFLCNFVGTGSDAEVVKKTMALLPPNAMETADKKFDEELALKLQPVHDIREVLEWLPFAACVASNSSRSYVKNALSKTLLNNYFGERVYSSRDLGKPKPAPDIFLHAAKENGFSPDQCVVVEDSIPGIKAAQNAGMVVIGFMGGKHFNKTLKDRLLAAKADYYCSSAIELREILLKMS